MRNENEKNDMSRPTFQRYAHDSFLGEYKNKGFSRDERDLYFGARQLERKLICADKIKELLSE